jgi:hypothetical protein
MKDTKPDCRCREKGLEFLEKSLPETPGTKMLVDAMKENNCLLGSIIQVLNGMTLGLLLFWFAVLAGLLLLNIFIRPAHPHFGVDAYWGFWAVFGLGVGCIMVFVMKRIIQPLIVRKEDYYGDI